METSSSLYFAGDLTCRRRRVLPHATRGRANEASATPVAAGPSNPLREPRLANWDDLDIEVAGALFRRTTGLEHPHRPGKATVPAAQRPDSSLWKSGREYWVGIAYELNREATG